MAEDHRIQMKNCLTYNKSDVYVNSISLDIRRLVHRLMAATPSKKFASYPQFTFSLTVKCFISSINKALTRNLYYQLFLSTFEQLLIYRLNYINPLSTLIHYYVTNRCNIVLVMIQTFSFVIQFRILFF